MHDAPPNLSVVLGGFDGVTTRKHTLYVQGRKLMTTSSDARLVRAVIRAASALVAEPTAEQLRLDAVPVVAPDGSVVPVDHGLGNDLRAIERRLTARGYRVLDCAAILVDPAPGAVTIPDARAAWAIDDPALDAAFPARPGDNDLDALDALDGPLTRIVHPAHEVPASRAATVASIAALARRHDGTLRADDVARLAELINRVRVVPSVLTESPVLLDLVTGHEGARG